MLVQAGRGGGNSAKPNVVPSAAQESDKSPYTLTTHSVHRRQSRGTESPIGDVRTPSTDYLAHLRGYITQQDFLSGLSASSGSCGGNNRIILFTHLETMG